MMLHSVDLLARALRRQQRAESARRAVLARRLRDAGHPLLAGLPDKDILTVIELGVRSLRRAPFTFGTPRWQRHVAGVLGQRGLRRRLAGLGVQTGDYFRWLVSRSRGNRQASPFFDPPKRRDRTVTNVAPAPQTATARSVERPERPRTVAFLPLDRPASVPRSPWLTGNWRVRR